MHILIAGGSGFIGKHLYAFLKQNGHQVTILSRQQQKTNSHIAMLHWDGKRLDTSIACDAIINLCGENIAAKRWTASVKQRLLESRVQTTKAIVEFIKNYPHTKKPRLLNASAIGLYASAKQVQTETSYATPATHSFAYNITHAWETQALNALKYGAQACCLRFGVVLGKDGGALSKMLPAFKFGLGAVIGNSYSHLSWVHIADVCRAILFILQLEQLEQAYNITAPNPCTQSTFANSLAKACHKPCFMRVPPLMVKLLFGELGEQLLLADQSIVPQRLLDTGFSFEYQDIATTWHALLT